MLGRRAWLYVLEVAAMSCITVSACGYAGCSGHIDDHDDDINAHFLEVFTKAPNSFDKFSIYIALVFILYHSLWVTVKDLFPVEPVAMGIMTKGWIRNKDTEEMYFEDSVSWKSGVSLG